MAKIAQLTARYIADHPNISACLARDMINYSKLARQIAKEMKISKLDAVIVACRRYASLLRKSRKQETGISILKKSKKTIKIENNQAHIIFTINEKSLTRVLESLK